MENRFLNEGWGPPNIEHNGIAQYRVSFDRNHEGRALVLNEGAAIELGSYGYGAIVSVHQLPNLEGDVRIDATTHSDVHASVTLRAESHCFRSPARSALAIGSESGAIVFVEGLTPPRRFLRDRRVAHRIDIASHLRQGEAFVGWPDGVDMSRREFISYPVTNVFNPNDSSMILRVLAGTDGFQNHASDSFVQLLRGGAHVEMIRGSQKSEVASSGLRGGANIPSSAAFRVVNDHDPGAALIRIGAPGEGITPLRTRALFD
jgi:hypothetical protein